MAEALKAVRADRELDCAGIDAGLRSRGVDLTLLPGGVSDDELARRTHDADLILTCYQPVTGRVIESAARLRGIVKYGVGIDAIDVGAARRRGIPVVNVPTYAQETVAECALALLLALARKVVPIHREMAATGWVWPTPQWCGVDVAGKTVGLVGMGRIGRSMARMVGQGLRARVLGFDPYVDDAAMRSAGVEKRVDLRAMLADCDFVSLHAALTADNENLIGAPELGAMKPASFLINVARGGLVDEHALVQALESKQIAGAGLDTFQHEPLERATHTLSPLYSMDNVILFPHLAFYTHEAVRRLEEETLARCVEILDGKPVLVRSTDPRLTSQTQGVVFGG